MKKSYKKNELIEFEREISNLFEQGKINTPIHLSGGNEDQLIEIFKEINEEDYILSTHRSHYHYLLKGGSKEELREKILNGKSMHLYNKNLNFLSSSIVAGCSGIAAGIALAIKKKKENRKVWCFVGDGAEDEGHFYEAVRYVEGWDLPCTFIIEDNNRSVETKKKDRYGKSEFNWPSCVRRYNYEATYPHTGTGKWVTLPIVTNEFICKNKGGFKKIKVEDYNKSSRITYKEAIKMSMENFSKDKKTIFIGYNVKYGTRGYGTLTEINEDQILETPLAENLMADLAIGLALEGFKPILFFERHDFMLNASDAIINHIDKIYSMSEGQFNAPVLIRATVGSKTPLDPGPQHTQDFSYLFNNNCNCPVYKPVTSQEILKVYKELSSFKLPAIIIEERDLYGKQ